MTALAPDGAEIVLSDAEGRLKPVLAQAGVVSRTLAPGESLQVLGSENGDETK